MSAEVAEGTSAGEAASVPEKKQKMMPKIKPSERTKQLADLTRKDMPRLPEHFVSSKLPLPRRREVDYVEKYNMVIDPGKKRSQRKNPKKDRRNPRRNRRHPRRKIERAKIKRARIENNACTRVHENIFRPGGR